MPDTAPAPARRAPNNRLRLAVTAGCAALLIAAVVVVAAATDPAALEPTAGQRNEPPSAAHWLGTDWLGRDLAARTVVGLRLSLGLGVVAAGGATVMAAAVALAGTLGPGWVRAAAGWLTDATLGVPQIVSSLMISFAVGGGAAGVAVAITLTGWPPLARMLRGEILAVASEDYIEFSRARGEPVVGQIAAAVFPQVLVGLLIAFPHAIVHESMLTFIGFGIEATTPSLGIVLSEGLRYLANGQWWAVAGPVALLVTLATLLDRCGDLARRLLHPVTRHQ